MVTELHTQHHTMEEVASALCIVFSIEPKSEVGSLSDSVHKPKDTNHDTGTTPSEKKMDLCCTVKCVFELD